MKEADSKMEAVLERLNLDVVEKQLPSENKMTSSELRNNSKWRGLLEEFQTVEITTNGQTVAQLNRPELVPSLVAKIKALELELEQHKIQQLYGDRIENFDESNYKSGAELEKGALKLLDLYMKTGKIE